MDVKKSKITFGCEIAPPLQKRMSRPCLVPSCLSERGKRYIIPVAEYKNSRWFEELTIEKNQKTGQMCPRHFKEIIGDRLIPIEKKSSVDVKNTTSSAIEVKNTTSSAIEVKNTTPSAIEVSARTEKVSVGKINVSAIKKQVSPRKEHTQFFEYEWMDAMKLKAVDLISEEPCVVPGCPSGQNDNTSVKWYILPELNETLHPNCPVVKERELLYGKLSLPRIHIGKRIQICTKHFPEKYCNELDISSWSHFEDFEEKLGHKIIVKPRPEKKAVILKNIDDIDINLTREDLDVGETGLILTQQKTVDGNIHLKCRSEELSTGQKIPIGYTRHPEQNFNRTVVLPENIPGQKNFPIHKSVTNSKFENLKVITRDAQSIAHVLNERPQNLNAIQYKYCSMEGEVFNITVDDDFVAVKKELQEESLTLEDEDVIEIEDDSPQLSPDVVQVDNELQEEPLEREDEDVVQIDDELGEQSSVRTDEDVVEVKDEFQEESSTCKDENVVEIEDEFQEVSPALKDDFEFVDISDIVNEEQAEVENSEIFVDNSNQDNLEQLKTKLKFCNSTNVETKDVGTQTNNEIGFCEILDFLRTHVLNFCYNNNSQRFYLNACSLLFNRGTSEKSKSMVVRVKKETLCSTDLHLLKAMNFSLWKKSGKSPKELPLMYTCINGFYEVMDPQTKSIPKLSSIEMDKGRFLTLTNDKSIYNALKNYNEERKTLDLLPALLPTEFGIVMNKIQNVGGIPQNVIITKPDEKQKTELKNKLNNLPPRNRNMSNSNLGSVEINSEITSLKNDLPKNRDDNGIEIPEGPNISPALNASLINMREKSESTERIIGKTIKEVPKKIEIVKENFLEVRRGRPRKIKNRPSWMNPQTFDKISDAKLPEFEEVMEINCDDNGKDADVPELQKCYMKDIMEINCNNNGKGKYEKPPELRLCKLKEKMEINCDYNGKGKVSEAKLQELHTCKLKEKMAINCDNNGKGRVSEAKLQELHKCKLKANMAINCDNNGKGKVSEAKLQELHKCKMKEKMAINCDNIGKGRVSEAKLQELHKFKLKEKMAINCDNNGKVSEAKLQELHKCKMKEKMAINCDNNGKVSEAKLQELHKCKLKEKMAINCDNNGKGKVSEAKLQELHKCKLKEKMAINCDNNGKGKDEKSAELRLCKLKEKMEINSDNNGKGKIEKSPEFRMCKLKEKMEINSDNNEKGKVSDAKLLELQKWMLKEKIELINCDNNEKGKDGKSPALQKFKLKEKMKVNCDNNGKGKESKLPELLKCKLKEKMKINCDNSEKGKISDAKLMNYNLKEKMEMNCGNNKKGKNAQSPEFQKFKLKEKMEIKHGNSEKGKNTTSKEYLEYSMRDKMTVDKKRKTEDENIYTKYNHKKGKYNEMIEELEKFLELTLEEPSEESPDLLSFGNFNCAYTLSPSTISPHVQGLEVVKEEEKSLAELKEINKVEDGEKLSMIKQRLAKTMENDQKKSKGERDKSFSTKSDAIIKKTVKSPPKKKGLMKTIANKQKKAKFEKYEAMSTRSTRSTKANPLKTIPKQINKGRNKRNLSMVEMGNEKFKVERKPIGRLSQTSSENKSEPTFGHKMICRNCNTLVDDGIYLRHVKNCTKKKVPCRNCNQFFYKRGLWLHSKSCSVGRCEHCRLGFPSMELLREHLRKLKNGFLCENCRVVFCGSDINTHKRQCSLKHRITVMPVKYLSLVDTNYNRYCKLCHESFESFTKFTKHVYLRHRKEENKLNMRMKYKIQKKYRRITLKVCPYKCRFCGRSSTNTKEKIDHYGECLKRIVKNCIIETEEGTYIEAEVIM